MGTALEPIELSFSMPLCCFLAALLVQGIIDEIQSGNTVQSQHGSSAVPKLVHTAGLGVWAETPEGPC